PGDYVGEDAVLTVASIDPLNVEVVVPVAQFGSIRKGMRAEVRPEAPVGGTYIATVVIVDRVIDAASGTFGVRLLLPNPSNKLPAGLNCDVTFLTK
ncbi:MAG: efflux RND transporter periplasmic adaptor subunit, partial [Desulfuromonadaceae bacterium]|nr:efflux RND transporter periplasmic adaptor subunit [Desulfuromonadaceae bacterium]